MKQRSAGKPDIELGKRIRLRRVEQRISQAELGDQLGAARAVDDPALSDEIMRSTAAQIKTLALPPEATRRPGGGGRQSPRS